MKFHGMTLIELMVALAIFSIVLTYSIPLGTDYFDKIRVRKAHQAIIHALGLGRAMALGGGKSLALCGSREGRFCDGDWSKGILLIDRNEQKTQYFWPNFSKRLTIQWKGWQGNVILNISPYLSEQALSGHFTLSSGERQEKLVLNRLGRWRRA